MKIKNANKYDIINEFWAPETRKKISKFSLKLDKQAEQSRSDLVT